MSNECSVAWTCPVSFGITGGASLVFSVVVVVVVEAVELIEEVYWRLMDGCEAERLEDDDKPFIGSEDAAFGAVYSEEEE
jgi:hypothetical protein